MEGEREREIFTLIRQNLPSSTPFFRLETTETLRQEYYAVGVGAVTSPAPPEASDAARVPVLVQLLVQVGCGCHRPCVGLSVVLWI